MWSFLQAAASDKLDKATAVARERATKLSAAQPATPASKREAAAKAKAAEEATLREVRSQSQTPPLFIWRGSVYISIYPYIYVSISLYMAKREAAAKLKAADEATLREVHIHIH